MGSPTTLQVSISAQAYRFAPVGASVLKNTCPTLHRTGRVVPDASLPCLVKSAKVCPPARQHVPVTISRVTVHRSVLIVKTSFSKLHQENNGALTPDGISLKPLVVRGWGECASFESLRRAKPCSECERFSKPTARRRSFWSVSQIGPAREFWQRLTESNLGVRQKKGGFREAFRESRVCLFLLTR